MRTLQLSSLLVLVLLLLCGTTFLSHRVATAQEFGGRADGYKRIKDVKDYHVVGIANYAVEEHNRQLAAGGEQLRLVRIIRGYLDGRYYKLIITAAPVGDGAHGGERRYEAVVWEKLWDKLRELVSFKLL